MIQCTVWANVSTLAYPTRTKGEVGGTHSADDGESGRFTSISSPSEVWFSLLIEWRNSSRKKSVGENGNIPQLWMCLVVKVK